MRLEEPQPLERADAGLRQRFRIRPVAGDELRAEARTTWKTGVEMEALTAVTVAALTVIDMGKAIDKAMVIEGVRLIEKTGGKSGDYRADAEAAS